MLASTPDAEPPACRHSEIGGDMECWDTQKLDCWFGTMRVKNWIPNVSEIHHFFVCKEEHVHHPISIDVRKFENLIIL